MTTISKIWSSIITADAAERRRRFAWTTVMLSFFIFMSMCVSIPFLLNAFLQNSRQPLITAVSTNQGTVAVVRENGDTAALLTTDPPTEIPTQSTLITNAADTALIQAFSPVSMQLILRGQMYGNTRLNFNDASAPRFGLSSANQHIDLEISNGRLRFTVIEPDRDVDIRIRTPHGTVTIRDTGQYAIDVNNQESQISVQGGLAELSSFEDALPNLLIGANQRGMLSHTEAPSGPLDTERNLITNGDFGADLSSWIEQEWNVELSEQPQGETRITATAGEPALQFARVGIGHADASVRQILDQDVTDYDSLRLLISFRINNQSLNVCGTVGSECPLTIRVAYEDSNNANLTWEQGFYAQGGIAPDTPDICINCSPPYNPHRRILSSRVTTHEVDILESLALQGFSPPRRIHSISLIAAGHGFDTEIFDVAILAKE